MGNGSSRECRLFMHSEDYLDIHFRNVLWAECFTSLQDEQQIAYNIEFTKYACTEQRDFREKEQYVLLMMVASLMQFFFLVWYFFVFSEWKGEKGIYI